MSVVFAAFGVGCGDDAPSDALPQGQLAADGGPDAASGAGPENEGDSTPGAASVVVDDASYQFDPVAGGPTSVAHAFHFTNVGGSPSAVLATDIHGNDFAKFAIASDDCAGTSLDPGASCTVAVTLGSITAGGFEATLRVHGTPGGVARVDLSGIVTDALLVFQPSDYSLGPVLQGSGTAATLLKLQNVGGATSGPVALAPLASGFAVATDECTGHTIAAGASCRIGVNVTADANAVGPLTSTLVATGAPGGSASASLHAQVQTLATIDVSSVDFGHVGYYFGLTPATQTMVVTNRGQTAGQVTSVAPSGAGYAFTFDESGCLGVTLQPGDSCAIAVTPASTRYVGDETATFAVSVDNGHQGSGTAAIHYDLDGSELDVELDPSMGTLSTSAGDVCSMASCRFVSTGPLTVTAQPATGYQFSVWRYTDVFPACAGTFLATCTVPFSSSNFIQTVAPVFATK